MQTRASARSGFLGGVVVAAALLVAACGATANGEDPGAGGADPSSSSAGGLGVSPPSGLPSSATASNGIAAADCDDAAAPAGDAGYFTCRNDHDCVAVRLLSNCCYNGWKIAVARDEVAAYLAATACAPMKQRFCPEYVVVDSRVPACDVADHTCFMAEPQQVRPGTDG